MCIRDRRNADGTGVLAGVTLVGNVRGYTMIDDERRALDGKLIYRGIDVEDIVAGITAENRFGYEEVVYLILFGQLPNRDQLDFFTRLLDERCV